MFEGNKIRLRNREALINQIDHKYRDNTRKQKLRDKG